jgi:putative glutamine amidotransferase
MRSMHSAGERARAARDDRPRIGLTLMTDRPIHDTHVPRYGMNRTYFASIRHAGGIPVPLAPGDAQEMRLFFSRDPQLPAEFPLDGLCLAGGGDLDPSFYGQPMRPGCGTPDAERDAMEIELLERVRNSDVPIFAICRGIQVLNAAWGGTLVQDIALERPGAGQHDWAKDHPRDHLAHEIRVAAGSRLRSILGGETARVNSLHHQAVDAPAPGLSATAWAPDGIVEAMEATDAGSRFLLAVQFHPEDLQEHAPMRRLFEAFVAAGRRYRQVRLQRPATR